MSGRPSPTWLLVASCWVGLFAGCSRDVHDGKAMPTPTPEPVIKTTTATASGDAASSSSPPPTDVPWSDRDDFELWQPPLPPGQDGWPTEPPSRWPDLRIRLVLPSSVHPGETLSYAVSIRNQSKRVVDLRPCGGYWQEVQVVGGGLAAEHVEGGESKFRLNCDESPRLRPGERRTYAMRLVVPGEVSGSEVLFTWGFIDNMHDYAAQKWIGLSAPTAE